MKNLETCILWAVEFANEVAKGMKDNKLSFSEAFGLMDNALELPAIIRAAKDVPAELETLTQEEGQLIVKAVASKLDLEHDKAEAIAVQAIAAGIAIGKLVKAIIK